MDQDPQEQGFPAHGFDILVAANVLHATRDMGASLDRALYLLAPHGLLVLYEVTEHLPWFELSVGLIDGWQAHQDDVRHEHPLLAPEQWRDVLGRHRFDKVAFFPEGDAPTMVLAHHVIAARAPGVDVIADGRLEAQISDLARDKGEHDDGAEASAPTPSHGTPDGFVARLVEAGPNERGQLLVDLVRRRVMEILRLDASRILAPSDRLMHIGVDSLMALELKNTLGNDLQIGDILPATLVFDCPTIEAIARYLLGQVLRLEGISGERRGSREGPERESAEDSNQTARSAERLAAMSESEAEQLLLAQLEGL
jgi:hypothetical protein